MQKNKGFTLIELMVTIAVLGIIATLATPSFGNLIQKRKLETETRKLAFILSDLRSKATVLRKEVKLVFGTGDSTATTIYWMPSDSDIVLDTTSADVYFTQVEFTVLGQPKQKIIQIPNPDPSGTPAQIDKVLPLKFTLCNSKIKESRTLNVSLNGTVSDIVSGVCA